jgi:oxygen-independent coproporphyrinogen-3 oxidase
MVGLGCGARSYTQEVHYSREFAVAQSGVWQILKDYLNCDAEELSIARHGFRLDHDEQRRRYVIVSLLQSEGISTAAYRHRFGGSVWEDLPQLEELCEMELAYLDADALRLTPAGLERSDAIGPWLYSAAVTSLMESCPCR